MGKPAMGLNTYMAISFDFSLKKAILALVMPTMLVLDKFALKNVVAFC